MMEGLNYKLSECSLTSKFLFLNSLSVPLVPRGVTAYSTSSTSVEVNWMEPAVFFREFMNNCNTTILNFRCTSQTTSLCIAPTSTLMPPLSLSANDNSLTTYEVQYRGVYSPNDVGGAFFQPVMNATGMAQNYSIFGLIAHSAYNVSVRATNQYGVGNFSEEVTVRTEEGG